MNVYEQLKMLRLAIDNASTDELIKYMDKLTKLRDSSSSNINLGKGCQALIEHILEKLGDTKSNKLHL